MPFWEGIAMVQGFKDLKVFQLAFTLAMRIFRESKSFPQEERYSLTDQIRRSSRSVTANLAEGFRKRQYRNAFLSKLADADGEGAETQVWIAYAQACGYWTADLCRELTQGYEEVGRMLGGMLAHPEKFAPP
jgi:four helix bundle protein